MNKIPFDIVSHPVNKERGLPISQGIRKNEIIQANTSSLCEVVIFKHWKDTESVIGERAVFDYRKPSSNVFEATDTISNPSVFIPAQGGDFNAEVLRSRRRPAFYGMTGYLVPPYFDS